MTDLENKIIAFLKDEGMACPPGYIAFKIDGYDFGEVSAALVHLKALGLVRHGTGGAELIKSSKHESPFDGRPSDSISSTHETCERPNAPGSSRRTPTSAPRTKRGYHNEDGNPDAENAIVNLLKDAKGPYPPSHIAHRLPRFQFQQITDAINKLRGQGLVELTSGGVKLIPASRREEGRRAPRHGRASDQSLLPLEADGGSTNHRAKIKGGTGSHLRPRNMNTPAPAPQQEDRAYPELFTGMSERDIDSYFESLLMERATCDAWINKTHCEPDEPLIGGSSGIGQEEEEPDAEEHGDTGRPRPLCCGDPLDALNLSARTGNALGANGIKTALDLALYGPPSAIRELGRSGIMEILDELDRHARPLDAQGLESLNSWYGDESSACRFIFDQFGVLRSVNKPTEKGSHYSKCPQRLKELSIKSVGLPNSVEIALRKQNVLTLGRLCSYTRNELVTLFGLSRRQVSKAADALRHFKAHLASEDEPEHEWAGEIISVPNRVAELNASAQMAKKLLEDRQVPLYKPAASLWLNHMFGMVAAEQRDVERQLEGMLADATPDIQPACEASIARWATALCAEMRDCPQIEPRVREIPSDTWWRQAAKTVAGEFVELRFLPNDNRLLFALPSLQDWLETLVDDQSTTVLKRRLSGRTLDEVGGELGLSRGRARQLQNKALGKAPVLREDALGPLFEKYTIGRGLFCQIASCGPETYRYLELKHHSARTRAPHIAAALQDPSVPKGIREAIGSYVIAEGRKGMIQTEGGLIGPDRKSAVLYAMKRLASSGSEIVSIDTLYTELKGLVENRGFPKTILSSGHRELFSWIQRTGCIMAPTLNHLRLHDFDSYEYDDLRDCLEVMSEQNIECSAQLVFETWPDIMSDLDIRDCNELHFTIKARLGDKCPGIYSLGRNPMMTLGEADRGAQVRELIKEMGPISRNDLAKEYSRRYRVSQASFLASFLNDFRQYRSGSIYSIRSEGFTDEERDYVLGFLGDCGYFPLSLARQQYKGTFPASEASICDESLHPLGYSISQSLVVRDGVDIRRVFAKAIEGLDKFKEGDDGFSPDVFAHSQLASELNMRLRRLTIIEYGPRRYVKTQYLTKIYGVTKADIEQFIHVVSSSIPAGVPFTVQRLRCLGLSHKVDNALVTGEFDDDLLQGMLSSGTTTTGFRTSSIANTTLFCSGVSSIDAPRYIESVIQREGPLELDDLLDVLNREDGIATTASVLRQLIQRSALFYVPSLDEMVFSSENEYDDYVTELLNG